MPQADDELQFISLESHIDYLSSFYGILRIK